MWTNLSFFREVDVISCFYLEGIKDDYHEISCESKICLFSYLDLQS